MTSPETSEAEVEAAAKALLGMRWTGTATEVARAALTAAAQVRAQTEATAEQIMILDKIEQTSLGLFRSVRGADSDGIKTAMDAQQLILDYGRTFPRRPAVLGIRKGE